ncbi:MAG TPA: site-2 protease family protein [Candidatus Dormibacteraeota bacterium]|nr:site-2 protease family protein [Candidatus Dormibacteraeota bacterium]
MNLSFNFVDLFIRALLLVPALLIAIPVHEIGHALAAYFIGDRSVRYFGYLKPDPRRYLDPYGAIAVFLAIVGWGRRVPVQSNRITTPGQKVLYELGGPAANLAVAIVLGIVWRVLLRLGLPFSFEPGPGLLLAALFAIVFLNLSVFAFNLLPIPGLDGWNIIEALFKSRNARFFYDVAIRQREIWVGCVIAIIVFQFLFGISLLSIVMTPFFEPASLISLNGCADYRIPNLAFLFPCLL